MLQRLFSSFPDSWPGAGLILLRLAIGLPLVVNPLWAGLSGAGTASLVSRLAELLCGSLILLGLWTPVAGIAAALLQLTAAFDGHQDFMHFAWVFVPLSVAVLGPGAWSIDARLYGRRRIRV